MFRIRFVLSLLLITVMAAGAALVVSAQEEPTVLADGLHSPRQLMYADDGTLYVAEAGVAGDAMTTIQEEQAVRSGLTSRISAISPDGELSVVVPALPSTEISPGNPGYRGAQAVYVTEDLIWVGVGEAVNTNLDIFPLFATAFAVDRETGRIVHMADTLAAELAQNPDGDAVASDPVDFAMTDDGTFYIVDAGCNCLWTWSEAEGLALFHNWAADDNPVPTGMAPAMNGEFFVSFLSGFPFPEGGARVERWSADGELQQTIDGLTLVTDVMFDGTDLYIVEMASGLGDQGFVPESGRILRVDYESGGEPQVVAEGLNFPYAVAMSPDGMLAVSVNTAFSPEPQGQILLIDPS